MVLINATAAGTVDGVEQVRALVLASETPETLPVDGSDVDGMRDDVLFAPMSVLYVTGSSDVYIANEDGEFVKQ